jgi:hypothetical protein
MGGIAIAGILLFFVLLAAFAINFYALLTVIFPYFNKDRELKAGATALLSIITTVVLFITEFFITKTFFWLLLGALTGVSYGLIKAYKRKVARQKAGITDSALNEKFSIVTFMLYAFGGIAALYILNYVIMWLLFHSVFGSSSRAF